MRCWISKLCLALLLFEPGVTGGAEIQVFAAASLSDALAPMAEQFHKETGHRVQFNFAGSSILARQIQAGARADLFISADAAKTAGLDTQGHLVPGSRVALLSNTLVVAVPKGAHARFTAPADLLRAERIAMGEPNTVPAGIYARRWLESEGLWTQLRERIVPTTSVRGALAAVEAGNVDAGIVYRTDLASADNVELAWAVPRAAGPEITYEAALVREGEELLAARVFLAFLQGREAAAIFTRHGFLVLE